MKITSDKPSLGQQQLRPPPPEGLDTQRLQNKVLCATIKLARQRSRDLHTVLKIPHVYDLITHFCRQQIEGT